MNKTTSVLWTLIVVLTLLLVIPASGAEAAKALKFVPTEVYYDDSGRLTLVGQFQNVGNEYVSGVRGFIPVIYLDGEMWAADTFVFQLGLQPGYYIEVIMRFDVSYRAFTKWQVKWDAFPVY
jgi:hypothetical protein